MLQGERARCGVRVLVVAALALGCATEASLPAISPTASGREHPGKFVWFDLLTEDLASAREFYGEVFGWSFDAPDAEGYALIRSGGVPIAGASEIDGRDADTSESLWLASLSVADVDAAAAVVADQGGEVLLGPLDAGPRGRLAAVRDPSGAALVLLRAPGGDPADGRPTLGSFFWADLWTADAGPATAFYGVLAGYEARDFRAGEGHVYHLLGRDGRARAGVVELEWKGIEPNWLPYVRVADVERTAQRATSAGGFVLLRQGDVAVLLDPSGAALGVQQLSGGGS